MRQFIGLSIGIFICLLFLARSRISAQTSKKISIRHSAIISEKIKPLEIGDKVPNILFHKILNYRRETARLSDFKGKLVILDMWSTFCANCISDFPKVENIQKKFEGKIQVLLVNPHGNPYDSEERINRILGKNKIRTGYYPSLPIPISDTILNQLFPHKSVPHYIWIDQNLTLIGITRAQSFNELNIEKILSGIPLHLPTKFEDYDFTKPLLYNIHGIERNSFNYWSIFTGYNESLGFGNANRKDSDGNIVGFTILNATIRDLIGRAYSDILNGKKENVVELCVSDKKKFSWEFNKNNIFCYDISFPPINPSQFDFRDYLKQDLKRWFNISVAEKNKLRKCIVAKSSGAFQNICSKKSRFLDIDVDSKLKRAYNYSIREIIDLLNNFESPLICEIDNESTRVDIDFPEYFDIMNFEQVKEFLQRIEISLTEEMKELPVVIVTDK